MSKIKLLLTAVVCLFLVNSVFGQNETRDDFRQSYEVKLQILSASNKAGGKSEVPDALSAVVKKMRDNQSFSNYQLVETYFERITNGGQIELKTISENLSGDAEQKYPVFTDWSLKNLQTVKNSDGKNFLQFDSFRYGARIPVPSVAGNAKVVNYDSTGFTLSKFNLPENVPTVAGSFPTPQTGEFIFVILTVKKAAE